MVVVVVRDFRGMFTGAGGSVYGVRMYLSYTVVQYVGSTAIHLLLVRDFVWGCFTARRCIGHTTTAR